MPRARRSGLFFPIKDSGFLGMRFFGIHFAPAGMTLVAQAFFSPIKDSRFLGLTFFGINFAPAGMTPVVRGFYPQSGFQDV